MKEKSSVRNHLRTNKVHHHDKLRIILSQNLSSTGEASQKKDKLEESLVHLMKPKLHLFITH